MGGYLYYAHVSRIKRSCSATNSVIQTLIWRYLSLVIIYYIIYFGNRLPTSIRCFFSFFAVPFLFCLLSPLSLLFLSHPAICSFRSHKLLPSFLPCLLRDRFFSPANALIDHLLRTMHHEPIHLVDTVIVFAIERMISSPKKRRLR